MSNPYPFQPNTPSQKPKMSGGKKLALWITSISAAFVVIGVGAGLSSSDSPSPPTDAAASATTWSSTTTTTPLPMPGETPIAAAPAEPTTEEPEFPPQVEQARDKAQDYLRFMGFSREGLIEQLSSSAGEDFPKDVATKAVDSLTVDWNEQAAKKAQSYLDMTSFSCNGLIEQLSSSAGEGFTKAQATYGAHQTDACK